MKQGELPLDQRDSQFAHRLLCGEDLQPKFKTDGYLERASVILQDLTRDYVTCFCAISLLSTGIFKFTRNIKSI